MNTQVKLIASPPENDRLVILIQPGRNKQEKTFAVTARWTVRNSIGVWIGESTGDILSLIPETYWIECPIGQ